MHDQDEINRLKKWEEQIQEPVVLWVDEPKERPSVSFHAHLHIGNYDQPQTYDYPAYDDYQHSYQVHPIIALVFGLGFVFVVMMLIALLVAV